MATGIGGLLNLKQDGQNYAYLYDDKGNVEALSDFHTHYAMMCDLFFFALKEQGHTV